MLGTRFAHKNEMGRTLVSKSGHFGSLKLENPDYNLIR